MIMAALRTSPKKRSILRSTTSNTFGEQLQDSAVLPHQPQQLRNNNPKAKQFVVFRMCFNHVLSIRRQRPSPISTSRGGVSSPARRRMNDNRKSFGVVFLVSTMAISLLIISLVHYTMLSRTAPDFAAASTSTHPLRSHSDHKLSAAGRLFPPRLILFNDDDDHPPSHNKRTSSLATNMTSLSSTVVQQIYRVPYVQGNCIPIATWQVDSKPNCNSMHEIDFIQFVSVNANIHKHHTLKNTADADGSVALLGQGWFRMAWKLHTGLATAIPKPQKQQEEGHHDDYYSHMYEDYLESNFQNAISPPVILKTLRFERDFLDEYYDLHRRDAMAMERLTFSPFVLDVYGYCGQSAINEIAVDSVEKLFQVGNGYNFDNEYKLQTCCAIAMAVAHVHTFDYGSTSTTTLVHYDLNPRNVAIMADGTPKLNDFNLAEFLRWDNTTNTPCGFTGRFYEPWWRAPEEMKTTDYEKAKKYRLVYETNSTMLTEKVDVYSLGNIMYRILTGRAPRGKSIPEHLEHVREDLVNGYLPSLERMYSKSKDPNVLAILEAMLMCFQPDPNERSTAKQVSKFLAKAVKKIQGSRALKRIMRKNHAQ